MEWDTTSIVYITFEAITGFTTLFGNALVLIAIIRTRQLHTVTNVFIGNLAVADIFVGLFVAPLAALSFLGVPRNVHGCIFINCAILMFTNISILMLLGVAIERFIAIRLPYMYNRLLTIRRAMWLNGGIWILGSILGLIPMYGWNIAPDTLTSCSFTGVISMEYMIYFQFFGLIVVPITLMLCIYSYILCVIRKHAKRTDTLEKMFNEHRRSGRHLKKEVRAAKFFALLIVLFAVFWLPVNILNSFTLFCPSCYQPYQLLLTAIVMSHANSCFNPILYAASNSRIQRSIKALFFTQRGSDGSSAENQSGKQYASGTRGDASLSRYQKVSVIGVTTKQHFHNSKKITTSPKYSPKENDEDSVRSSSELRQLSAMSLVSKNDEGNEDYKVNHMHVSENSPDAQPVEATKVFALTGIDRSEEMRPLSDDNIVPGEPIKYSEYTGEHTLESDQVTVLQQDMLEIHTSPRTFEGHINLAYVDDKSNGTVSSLSLSPVRKLCPERTYHESETFTEILFDNQRYDKVGHLEGEHLKDSARNDEAGDRNLNSHTPSNVSPLKTVELFPAADGTSTVQKEPRHIRSAGPRSKLFEMEDEPSLEQDYNTFTFVTSGNADDDVVYIDKDANKQSNTNPRTNIVHTYFKSQNDTNSSKISDVEILAQDIFTNTESQQTKL